VQSTFTLATTTFASPVLKEDTQVNLTSTSGIAPGVFLYATREAMLVVALTGIGNMATVLRGREGTETRAHSTTETVYLAQGYQLFDQDPQGVPAAATFANPHINVRTGTLWVVQGDDVGPGTAARTWAPITSTQTIGALGVRVTTTTVPS
jgi:hypothetical protein